MISVKRLKEWLKKYPEDAKVTCGMNCTQGTVTLLVLKDGKTTGQLTLS